MGSGFEIDKSGPLFPIQEQPEYQKSPPIFKFPEQAQLPETGQGTVNTENEADSAAPNID